MPLATRTGAKANRDDANQRPEGCQKLALLTAATLGEMGASFTVIKRVESLLGGKGRPFFFGDPFEPGHRYAVQVGRNGDVRKGRVFPAAVPMHTAGRTKRHVARGEDLHLVVTHLVIADAVRGDQSELLSFTSDIVIAREGLSADRNSIRITDDEARVTYYACMLPNLSSNQRPLYEKLRERRLI